MTGRLLASCLFLTLSCGPDEHTGIKRHVYVPDEPAGGAGGADGAGGDGGEPFEPMPLGPPEVTAMMPLAGPYGTEVRVVGTNLGSSSRSGVTLTLGDELSRELDPDSDPEIVSWTESEIRFRFPFPLQGAVVVDTPEGSVKAGDFEPDFLPGEPLTVPATVGAVATIAQAAGTISAVLDTGPPELVTFDGAAPISAAITDNTIRPDTIRLYRDGSDLQAFALSTATDREIVALDPSDAFAATASGVTTSADVRIAGGKAGAAVWFRTGNDWERARPSASVWAIDKGPIPDPNPSAARHTAAATADGSLFIGWAEDTGDVLDSVGAPFYRRLGADSSTFTGKTRAGIDVDDSVSSFALAGRGNGVVGQYCGTDIDPLGVSGDDLLCYANLLPNLVQSTIKETSSTRYGFDGTAPAAAYCHPSLGTRLITSVSAGTAVSTLNARPGDVVAWPCTRVVAFEVDDDGLPLVILQHDGALYSPRPRVP